MKRFLPTIALIIILFAGYKMMSSGTLSPTALIALTGALFLGMLLMRPKNKGSAVSAEFISDLLGDFAKDAFTDDSQLSKDFATIVSQLRGNMPKAALINLETLAPKCRTDAERYAVAILSATILSKQDDYKRAIAEYNRAVVLNPTSDVAMKIGSCHQRLGQLHKARDSYEFAIELDPKNVQAMSAMATAWVADKHYENALEYAEDALELDANNASALATCAICHGLLGHPKRTEEYTEKAVRAGYNRKKIQETIKALKK